MAWTTLLNALFLPGKPITGATGTALRDNPIAIAEGEAGAPRILLPALERIVAGSTVKYRADATFPIAVATFTLVTNSNIGFMQAGTIRISLDHRKVSGAGQCETRIRRTRGAVVSAVTTFTNATTSFVTETQDVAVQPGDVLDIAIRDSAGATSEVRNIRYSASSTTFLWPVDRAGAIENNPTI